jgi:hypothetical protein
MKVSSQGAGTVNSIAETSVIAPRRTNSGSEQLFAKKSAAVYFAAAMRVVHDLCKRKKLNPAKELRLRTQHGIRACELYVAGDRVGGFGVAVDLLFTPEGPAHFEAWRAERLRLGLDVPAWADDFLSFIRVSNAMRKDQENSKQAEELQRLNDNL